MKTLLYIVSACLLVISCQRADNIEVYKVEVHRMEGYEYCECHVRTDVMIEIGEDSMVCYCYDRGLYDTIHYVKTN
jgi:hypothetical protein